jgi:hypothetical protein
MNAGVAGKTLTFAMMNYAGNGSARWSGFFTNFSNVLTIYM